MVDDAQIGDIDLALPTRSLLSRKWRRPRKAKVCHLGCLTLRMFKEGKHYQDFRPRGQFILEVGRCCATKSAYWEACSFPRKKWP